LAALAPVGLVLVIALTTLVHRRTSGAPVAGVLVHYRARTVFRPARDSGASFAYEITVSDVWVAGSERHRVDTDYFYSRSGRPVGAPLQHEAATDGRGVANFQAGALDPAGSLDESRAESQNAPCPPIVACGPSEVAVDPLTEVRRLLRSGRLVLARRDARIAGRVVDELRTTGVGGLRGEVRLFVAPGTFVPLEIVVAYGAASPVQTTTISDYSRTALNSSNRRMLLMRPHPGARPLCSATGGSVVRILPHGQGCIIKH
jgi:hypothetical protein